MNELVNIFIAATDLAEAEGRLLRSAVIRTLIAAGLGIGGIVLALVGLVVLVYDLYLFLANHLSVVASVGIIGLLFVLLAGGALWSMKRILR